MDLTQIDAQRDKRLKSHLIQELQVHQIVIGAALYDEGFTGIDSLVPAWSRGGDDATESRNHDNKKQQWMRRSV